VGHRLGEPRQGAGVRTALAPLSRARRLADRPARQHDRVRPPVLGQQRERRPRQVRLDRRDDVARPRAAGLQRRDGVGLGEQQPHLVADPVARDRAPVGRAGQRGRPLLHREPQPRRVARHPQDTRGVVGERALVQHPQAPRGDVVQGPGRGPDLPARQPDGDRVHGEVAAQQVLVQPGRPHVGQRPRRVVGLRARARDVHPPAVGGPHLRGPEAPVRLDDLAERRQDGLELALDRDVEIAHGRVEQRVAHRPAHQPQARNPPRRGQDGGPSWQPRQGLQDCFRRRVH
jgi:hypothetical protein